MSAGHFDDPIPFTYEKARRICALSIVAQRRHRYRHIDQSHDIPYLAGYSKDGKTIYLDRDLRHWPFDGRAIKPNRFLVLHEDVEKTLIDAINDTDAKDLYILLSALHMHAPDDRLYYHTHGVATAIEQNAVLRSHGEDGLRSYNRFMATQVKRAEDERIRRVPADLDLTPYTSSETDEDRKLLEVMKRRVDVQDMIAVEAVEIKNG